MYAPIPILDSTTLILLALIPICIAYFLYSRPRHLKEYPVMPCRPYPVLGHLPYLREPVTTLLKWKKQQGDIYSIYIGKHLYVVLAGYDVFKEAYLKKSECFCERPDVHWFSLFQDKEKGIHGILGPFWREIRNATISILRDFGMGKNLMAEKITTEGEKLIEELVKKKGKPCYPNALFDFAVGNVLMAVLIGRRFEYGDPLFTQFIADLHELSNLFHATTVIDIFSWVKYLPGDLFKAKRQRKIVDNFFEFFRKETEACKESLDDTSQDNFIKAYLRLIRKAEKSGEPCNLQEKDIQSLGFSLLVAGAASSSATMTWSLIYGMNFPETQRKVFEELKETVGTNRYPEMHDRKRLHYTYAFILETQRLGNVSPVAGLHLCCKTTEVAGYTIPKGAIVLPVLDGHMKNEEVFKDPWIFNPERFLDKDGTLQAPENHIPFFVGKRVCLGRVLASMELFLITAMLFQRFEMLPEDPNNIPTMDPVYRVPCSPKPFNVRFVERY